LTGYGATRVNWDAHHVADLNPSLVRGCCFGPRICYFGQSEKTDTWITVRGDDEIYNLQHNFSPHTSEQTATAAVTRLDLPRDAHLIRSKVGDGCKLFLYRSATVARERPDLGPYISVFYVSPPDETVYYPNNIWDATVMKSDNNIGRC
jgi:hypothetical protein